MLHPSFARCFVLPPTRHLHPMLRASFLCLSPLAGQRLHEGIPPDQAGTPHAQDEGRTLRPAAADAAEYAVAAVELVSIHMHSCLGASQGRGGRHGAANGNDNRKPASGAGWPTIRQSARPLPACTKYTHAPCPCAPPCPSGVFYLVMII